jgi:hypothetical protein
MSQLTAFKNEKPQVKAGTETQGNTSEANINSTIGKRLWECEDCGCRWTGKHNLCPDCNQEGKMVINPIPFVQAVSELYG